MNYAKQTAAPTREGAGCGCGFWFVAGSFDDAIMSDLWETVDARPRPVTPLDLGECQVGMSQQGLYTLAPASTSAGKRKSGPATATRTQLASLSEPIQQAYSLFQEAQTNGDTNLVEEIADTLRVQQALFDVDEFAQPMKARPRATVQRPRPQPEDAQLIMWRDESPSLPFGGL